MRYILFIISFNAFSQLSLPTFQSIHNNQESGNILQDNLILHLDASNPSSLDPNDLTMEEALILIEKRKEYDKTKKKGRKK